MKKIIAFTLTVIMLALACSPMVCADSESDIMSLLSELNIMLGDDDGNLRLDDYVSRAEFTKIAIASSKSKNTVAEGIKISPFKDVTYTHWAAPYVRAAVSAGIVEGYVDATFKPENTVSYEEALTMLLKVLGYTDEDFGYSWPYGQIGLANNLDMTENVGAEQGEALTRRQVANLVYNTLQTKQKDTQSKLITVFDCEVIEDVTIISSHNEDTSLAEDKVLTTAGTFKIKDSFNFENVGKKGDIAVKNGNNLIFFTPSGSDEGSFDKYVIYSQLSDAVIVYKDGSFTQIDITDGTDCYKDSIKSSYAAVKNDLKMGDVLYVRRDGKGSVDYVSYDKGNMEGPIRVTNSNWIANFDTDGSTAVMRDGNRVEASQIREDDIIYYSRDLNMVLAYTDKVTGVYEKASPTKDSPTRVTVSGKEYTVESVEAFNDLSSSGSFKYGDTVTLLLGRDGEVAGIAGGSAVLSGTQYGFVTETGKKDFTNPDNTVYSSYYAKVVTPDGNVNEYATDADYSSQKCAVSRVTFSNGKAVLTRQRSEGGVSGKVSASKNKIGNYTFADNVQILDTVGKSDDDAALWCKVYPQRLDGVTISSSRVRYCSINSSGEIEKLILDDVTGDLYTYGVITRTEKGGSYTIDINGTQGIYMTGFSTTTKGPHRLNMSNGEIHSMQALTQYSSRISSLDTTHAVIANQEYLLSDKVVVYKKTDFTNYMKITLNEAIESEYSMTAYYDKPASSGGRIRIIVAE